MKDSKIFVSGIHYPDLADLNSFYTYLGYMLLYLATLQGVCLTTGHLVSSRHLAASLSGLFITATGLTSHYLIHSDDLALWVGWIRSEENYSRL